MASIYDLKPAFQALLRPFTNLLARAGVTANQVTLSACGLSVAAAVWIGSEARTGNLQALWLVPGLMLARMALNAIDGMLAREHGMKSRLGGLLNELTDVVSDSALYLAFAYVTGVRPELVVAIALLASLSEMTGVVAVTIGASRRYDGPMGKSDRAFVFSLLAVLFAAGIPAGAWVDYFLAAVVALLVFTVINRSRKALAEGR